MLLFAAATAWADPTVAPCSVLEPRFTVDGKTVFAGKMFPVKVGERTALVTAHDLFGPNGGLPAQLTPAEVVAKFTSLTAFDATETRTECVRSTKALLVADAVPSGGGNDASRDLAVFLPAQVMGLDPSRASATKTLAPLPLAAAPPKVGDPVWVAFPAAGAPAQAAKVVELNAGFLFVEYANRETAVVGSVGAPVLDATGAVVGMNIGAGKMADGALIGSAVPLPALKDRITAALATSP